MAGQTDAQPQAHGFTFFVAVCFTINYIMGCGFLGVPEAFVDAGNAMGVIMMVVFAYFCNVTKDYLLESMGRMEALTRVAEAPKSPPAVPDREAPPGAGVGDDGPFKADDFVVTSRKFELADITERLMGRSAKVVYMVVLALYIFAALWAYAAVFGASMAANIPVTATGVCNVEDGNCETPYHIWLLVFAVIVVVLSCMDLEEQVSVQVVMSVARIIVVFLMLGTVFGAITCDGYAFTNTQRGQRMHSTGDFKGKGLSTLIPVAVYASIFHHSVPVLAQPVRDKTQLRGIFATAFAVTCVFYVFIGLVLGAYFGEGVDKQVNLNWEYYIGCQDSPHAQRPWWAEGIRFIVLIFPALDVMSAFPLNAITLGNNLAICSCGPENELDVALSKRLHKAHGWRVLFPCCTPRAGFAALVSQSDDTATAAGDDGYGNDATLCSPDGGVRHVSSAATDPAAIQHALAAHRRRFWVKIGFRLLAAVPPIMGAAWKHNLETILDYAGTVGVLLAFVVPPVLWLVSSKRCHATIAAWRAGSLASEPSLNRGLGRRSRSNGGAGVLPTDDDYTDATSSPNSTSLPESDAVHTLLERTLPEEPAAGKGRSRRAAPQDATPQEQLVKTPYASMWSGAFVSGTVLVFGVAVFMYVLVETADPSV